MPLETAQQRRQDQRQLAASTVVAARGAWRLLDRGALDASTPQYLARILPLLTAAQLTAVRGSEQYVTAALAEQGLSADADGELQPEAFSGAASDGRSLGTLLTVPIVRAKSLVGDGLSVDNAMRSARGQLDMIVQTQVADAGRVADGVAVAARPRVMYTRYATPPSCPRCVILAGRTYRYSQGFQRHPGCDCVMQPSTEKASEDLISDPKEAFERGQIRGLSKADAQAIRDGADINQVINAHRGMYTAGIGTRGQVKLTTEGTTRRGIASQSRRLFGENVTETTTRSGRRTVRRVQRIRPEQIYRDATSRSDAIRLLRLHGYLA